MKAVLQRVLSASVSVNGEVVGKTENTTTGKNTGLLVLLGVQEKDTEEDSSYLARKTIDLRIFEDEQGKMNKSIAEVAGSLLVISQFTLIADWRNGRRPGFSRAASKDEGERLYLHYVAELRRQSLSVQTGIFGADMQVSLINDGPVTLILDTREPVSQT